MKKNLFEMGTNIKDSWYSDNKISVKQTSTEIKEPNKHQLHFSKEKRRGKTVTIVKPFYLEKKEIQLLLKHIKKKLGTGGTVKENALEFQGEREIELKVILKNLTYRFKK